MSGATPDDERAPPRGLRRRVEQVATLAAHTLGAFVLPFAVAAGACAVFETSEVRQTSGQAVKFATALVSPWLFLHVAGVGLRARRLWRERVAVEPSMSVRLTVGAALDVATAAAVVVTRRGGWVLATGLVGLVLALAWPAAQFGVFAVVVLGAYGVVVSVSVAVATFGVRRASGAPAARSFSSSVCSVGEQVFDRVVVDAALPPGFSLRAVAPLPGRLGEESRWIVDGGSSRRSRAEVELGRVDRGVYVAGAAAIFIEDLLGITSVQVGASTPATLKVLPRLRPLIGVPATRLLPAEAAEAAPRPRPRAEDDLYDLRPFVRGDDVRRVHWRQTVRAGEWIVRRPESNPTESRRVRLVLDTACAADLIKGVEDERGLAGVLDVAVDAWLGLGRALHEAGHDVALVAAVAGPGGAVVVEELSCRATRPSAWGNS